MQSYLRVITLDLKPSNLSWSMVFAKLLCRNILPYYAMFIHLFVVKLVRIYLSTLKDYLKEVSRYKYFRKLAGNILTLKRFSIKLSKMLVGNLLTFRQLV